jgi:hypothetical protein
VVTAAKIDNWLYKHVAPEGNPYIYIGFICEGTWPGI